jgi:hypothetical protein
VILGFTVVVDQVPGVQLHALEADPVKCRAPP